MKFSELFCFCSTKDPTLLRSNRTASDPRVFVERENIILQFDRGAGMKYLDMNDFVRKGLLGSGSSSDVYLIERKRDGKKFAGKFFKGDVCSSEFIREAKIMNSCSKSCSTIVQMFGIMVIPNCLVMDYCFNGSLDFALREDNRNMKRGLQSEFPFLRRLGYILDMCKAVSALHKGNICHRDIAMRNLLLSDDMKHVLLADFSLSRKIQTAYESQSTLTTLLPEWSAPESRKKPNESSSSTGQEKYETWYSLKSDIWSMGITMFGIIDKGFSEDQMWKTLPSGFPEESKPSTKVFDRLEDLWICILRCWDKSPEKRPQSWDLEERIKQLVENPLKSGAKIEGYKRDSRWFSSSFTAHTGSFSVARPERNCFQSKWDDDLLISSTYLRMDTSPSSEKQVKKYNTESWKINAGSRSSISKFSHNSIWSQVKKKRSKKKQKQAILRTSDPEYSNGHVSSSSAPSLIRLGKFKSEPITPPSGKRLSDMLSPSTTYDDSPHVSEKMRYCSPIPINISFGSSATNMAYCGDRRFFKTSASRLSSSEHLFSPELQPVREDSPSCQILRRYGSSYIL